MTNLVQKEVHINSKLDIIPFGIAYDDTLVASSVIDLDRESKDIWVSLLVGASDSTTGTFALEESNGDGVWTRIWSADLNDDSQQFVKVSRTKRYLRMPAPDLEEATTTTVALTIYY